jgi:hypothetical protein
LIVNDPLGDPWLKYKFMFGFNIRIYPHELKRITSHKMKLSFFLDNKKENVIKEIKEHFTAKKLYSLEAEDYNTDVILENTSFTFMKYTKDGKINREIDLGKEAKNHFVHFYGEYNLNRRISWQDSHIDIMEMVTKLNIKKRLDIMYCKEITHFRTNYVRKNEIADIRYYGLF